MASKVWFIGLRTRSARESKVAKITRLFEESGLVDCVSERDLTAIKVHFGEMGADCFVSPLFIRPVVDAVKSRLAKPFVTDTNTLYMGARHNAVDHLNTAAAHGFVESVVGAPTLIADGLFGENERLVEINQKHFQTTRIAGAIARADSMIVCSHFKGHEMAGFGGAIKNLAMGCATGRGKRDQHSPRFFVIPEKCISCGECAQVCPTGAAEVSHGRAVIHAETCIGCSECYIHCPEKAVDLDWKTEIPVFMERMTEYALGAVQGKRFKVGYLNFLVNITPDCDCLPWSDAPIVPDVGFLASTDPVAIDRASFDLVNARRGSADTHLTCNLDEGCDKFTGLWKHTQGEIQLRYGEEIGLGKNDYELRTL